MNRIRSVDIIGSKRKQCILCSGYVTATNVHTLELELLNMLRWRDWWDRSWRLLSRCKRAHTNRSYQPRARWVRVWTYCSHISTWITNSVRLFFINTMIWRSNILLWKGHDDVINWKHFPRDWPFARGIHRSPVKSPHKGQWRGALMFYLIRIWINNREAGDLRPYRAHYDVTVMRFGCINQEWQRTPLSLCSELSLSDECCHFITPVVGRGARDIIRWTTHFGRANTLILLQSILIKRNLQKLLIIIIKILTCIRHPISRKLVPTIGIKGTITHTSLHHSRDNFVESHSYQIQLLNAYQKYLVKEKQLKLTSW